MPGWVLDHQLLYRELPNLPSDLYCNSLDHAVNFQDKIHIFVADTYLKHYSWDGSSWTSVTESINTSEYQGENPLAVVFENEIHVILGTLHYAYDGTSWRSVSTVPEEINTSIIASITVADVPYGIMASSRMYYSSSEAIIISFISSTNEIKTYVYQNRHYPPDHASNYSWKYEYISIPSSANMSLDRVLITTSYYNNKDYAVLVGVDNTNQKIIIYSRNQSTSTPVIGWSMLALFDQGNISSKIPTLPSWDYLYDVIFVRNIYSVGAKGKLCLIFSVDGPPITDFIFSNDDAGNYGNRSKWVAESEILPGSSGSELVVFDGKIHSLGGGTIYSNQWHSFLSDALYKIKNAWTKDLRLMAQDNKAKRVYAAWIGDENDKAKQILKPRYLGFEHFDVHSFAPTMDTSFVYYKREIHAIRGKWHWKWTPNNWLRLDELPHEFATNLYANYPLSIVYKDKIHVLGDYVHYTWDGEKWSKESDLPGNNSLNGGNVVIYKDELHLFKYAASPSFSYRHYKYSNKQWIDLGVAPYHNTEGFVVVYNNQIHYIEGDVHMKWDETSWVNDVIFPILSASYVQPRTATCLIFENKIHVIYVENTGSSYTNATFVHWAFDGTSWTKVDQFDISQVDEYPFPASIVYKNAHMALFFNDTDQGTLYLNIKMSEYDFLKDE